MNTETVQHLKRLESAFSNIIFTPRLRELHRIIQDSQALSKITSEPQCIALEGEPGVGKSTMAKVYLNSFPRQDTEDGTVIPVFYAETPSPVTVKGMAAAMLEQLGDPAAHKGTLAQMNSRLINFILDCKVELVILDDFQHLIDLERDRILESVSDWLKYLIKETGVPFLVIGTEGKVTRILQANAQLSRLFAFRESLQPFIWEPPRKSNRDSDEFAIFVRYTEETIGLPLTSEICRVELLNRLYYATDGFIANITNLLRYAALLALRMEKSELTLHVLEIAYGDRLSKHMAKQLNPFSIPATDNIGVTCDPKPMANINAATGRRIKGNKKRQQSIAETLRK